MYEEVLFKALVYIVYVRERYGFFSSVYIKKVLYFGVKVDILKGALRFRGLMHNRRVNFIQFTFHLWVSYDN